MTMIIDAAERAERGRTIQSEILGQEPSAPLSLLEESRRDFIFAEVWSRPGLDRRSRYLIGMAGSAICGGETVELDEFVSGAVRSGLIGWRELREAALHLAVYAGWARGRILDRAIDRTASRMDLTTPSLPPIQAFPWDPAIRSDTGAQEFDDVMKSPGAPPSTPYRAAVRDFVFAEMWKRPGLDQRSRRWITLVGVAASDTEVPIRSHIHAAMASGNCTPDEMHEFVLQYGVHAGWPKASIIQSVVTEMIERVAAGQPYYK